MALYGIGAASKALFLSYYRR